MFFQNVDAIIGPDEPIVYPEGLTGELDHELALAVVIGRSGKFFGPDEAASHIAGYTVFNDITARDIQRRETGSGPSSFAKAIDTCCPIGPWIVTADPFASYLRPGDVVEAFIEGVGRLRNPVVPWSAVHTGPPYSTDQSR